MLYKQREKKIDSSLTIKTHVLCDSVEFESCVTTNFNGINEPLWWNYYLLDSKSTVEQYELINKK